MVGRAAAHQLPRRQGKMLTRPNTARKIPSSLSRTGGAQHATDPAMKAQEQPERLRVRMLAHAQMVSNGRYFSLGVSALGNRHVRSDMHSSSPRKTQARSPYSPNTASWRCRQVRGSPSRFTTCVLDHPRVHPSAGGAITKRRRTQENSNSSFICRFTGLRISVLEQLVGKPMEAQSTVSGFAIRE
jgi:hypothetical protein